MTKKHLSLGKLLSNNKIVAAVSIILAVIIWLIVALFFSDQQEATLAEIPVTIDTTITDKLDLQMFGQTDFTVTMKVTGKRYEVSQSVLSSKDFVASASTVNVSSAGKYTLPITVKPVNGADNVGILSFSPESVDVFFDYNLTQNYTVEPQLVHKGELVPNGYLAGDTLLSNAEVTISGAASEVNKIARVVAKVNIPHPLMETTKFEKTDLSILNANNGIVRSAYVSIADGITDVTVTVPVLKVMQFKPTVLFKNAPNDYVGNQMQYTVSPAGMVNAAVSTDLLSSVDTIALGTIDFADVTAGLNSFEFKASEIPNIRILDDVDTFKVEFTMDGVQSRRFTLRSDEITFTGMPKGVSATIPQDEVISITVIGTPEELDTLTTEDILATADASVLKKNAGTVRLPLSFSMEKASQSWVFGEYGVDVDVS